MTNKEIALSFDLLAKIMELHQENPFKIRSYQNAYLVLRKMDKPLAEFTMEELMEVKGIGAAIAEKIQSLVRTGHMPTLDKYLAKTPPGVVEMLKLQGLGPKKIEIIWKELGIESPGELLYACNENRLVELKGFGEKTQHKTIEAIGFLESNLGKYLFAQAGFHANQIIELIHKLQNSSRSIITGPLRRGMAIVERADILTTCEKPEITRLSDSGLSWTLQDDTFWEGIWNEFLPVRFHFVGDAGWISRLVETTGPATYTGQFKDKFLEMDSLSEESFFIAPGLPFLTPELRDIPETYTYSREQLDQLIQPQDIRGVIHCHSTYSDGIHSMKEMVLYAKKLGYSYLVITDHSQAAVYAKGMKPDRLMAQWEEIDQINQSLDDFYLFKGIECDILSDGSLDYDENILTRFDLVIASIHSAFQMDEEKATRRMIKAIENPYTNIIGHPTGRLLLSREGYPLDFNRIIDACKANQVAIELNANPQRLDLDSSFIPGCVKQGVFISINPDAHSRSSIADISYGVIAARKGLLPKKLCLNHLNKDELMKFCKKKDIKPS